MNQSRILILTLKTLAMFKMSIQHCNTLSMTENKELNNVTFFEPA